jgi:hypothetical protein
MEYQQHPSYVYYVLALVLNAISQIFFALNVYQLHLNTICFQLVPLQLALQLVLMPSILI